LQRLQNLCTQLSQTNKELQRENQYLKLELAKHNSTLMFTNNDKVCTHEDFSIPPILAGFQDLSRVDGLLGEDQFRDLISPTISSPIQSADSENELSYDEEQDYYKISKRKMLLIFLFMIPLFFGFKGLNIIPQMNNEGRVVLESNVTSEDFYLDILQQLSYFVGVATFTSWFVHSLMWVHGLGKYTTAFANHMKKLFLSQPITTLD